MADEIVKTVKSSGGDYSSLSAFEAGEQRNLVTADEIAVAECYNFEDTTAVVFDGWTTDSTRYIHVRIPTAQLPGRTAGSAYRIINSTTGHNIQVNEDYTIIEGIESKLENGTTSDECIRVSADGCLIDKCLCWSDQEVEQQDGIYTKTDNATVTVRNCVVYSMYRAGYHVQAQDPGDIIGMVLQNCTAFDCGGTTEQNNDNGGVVAAAYAGTSTINMSVKNTIAMNSASGDEDFHTTGSGSPGTVNWSGNNNISSDTSATAKFSSSYSSRTATTSTTPGTGDWVVFTNLTGGSEDFHLQSSSENDAEGNGADLSGIFNDDFDGDSRPESGPWDIGMDQIVVSTVIPVIQHHRQQQKTSQ